jgi:hypothetical protein
MPNIPQVRLLMSKNERIGMGFNSDSGLAVGTPFEMDNIVVEKDPSAPGQVAFSTITLINTHEELMKNMGLSVEAEGRYGFFSAALKAQFAETTSYNSTSTFLMAKVIVQNPFLRGRNFKLTPDANAVLQVPGTGIKNFKTAFGDSFARGLQTGGEFYAVIRITSVSSRTERDLAASLEAEYNGLVAAGKFKGKFTEANQNENTKSEFNAMMYQRAGIGEEIAPTVEVNEVLERVKKFSSIVFDHPVAYEVEVATYDTLPLPLPPPEEQEDFLIALGDAQEKKLHYIQTKNDLEFARGNPEFFQALPADDVLANAIQVYTKLINAVMSHGIELSTGQMRPPRLFDPSTLTPPLSEPAPIPLPRVTPPTVKLRMPDLLALGDTGFDRIEDLLVCLEHGGDLDGCLAGTVFTGQDNIVVPVDLPRDVAEFLNLYVHQQIKVRWIPGDPVDVSVAASQNAAILSLSIQSQFPAPGVEVTDQSEVIVNILEVTQ